MQMEILELTQQTPTLFSVRLAPKEEDIQIHFQAGQCVNVLTPSEKKTCFSIASEPEEKNFIELLIKAQPDSPAHEISKLKVGERLKMSHPFGKGFPIDRFKNHDLLLVGIGSGLAPLRSLLKSLLRKDHQFKQITFVYGARNKEEVPFTHDFDLWSKKINAHLALTQPATVEAGIFQGRVTDFIPNLKLNTETICCICGTKEMEEQVRKLLETKGVSSENILLNY